MKGIAKSAALLAFTNFVALYAREPRSATRLIPPEQRGGLVNRADRQSTASHALYVCVKCELKAPSETGQGEGQPRHTPVKKHTQERQRSDGGVGTRDRVTPARGTT
jgi:hypothetical protein